MSDSSTTPPQPAVDVAYYGRQTRSSLGWLVLALFLGGVPIAAYFTTPDPSVTSIALGLILGGPCLFLSLSELGKSTVVILNPKSRQIRYLEGSYAQRRSRSFSYDEVQGICLTRGSVHVYRGGSSEWWEIHVAFNGKREITLEESSYQRANHCARHLAAALNVRAIYNGEPLAPIMVAVPRAVSMPAWTVVAHVFFYALGAIILMFGIIGACLHYLKH